MPTAAHFLDRLERANESDSEQRFVVRYCLELALLALHMIDYPVPVLVASALFLSNELAFRKPLWPAMMAHHTRLEEAELQRCVKDLRLLAENASKDSLQAVYKKYQSKNALSVARLFRCCKKDVAAAA